jgi:hypothetical protein
MYQAPDYSAVQKYIDEARMQRAVYLADLISTGIVKLMNMFKLPADVYAETKYRLSRNVFTVE